MILLKIAVMIVKWLAEPIRESEPPASCPALEAKPEKQTVRKIVHMKPRDWSSR